MAKSEWLYAEYYRKLGKLLQDYPKGPIMQIEIDDKVMVITEKDERGKDVRTVIPRYAREGAKLSSLEDAIYSSKKIFETDGKFDSGYMRGWDNGYDTAVRHMREGVLTWDEITK